MTTDERWDAFFDPDNLSNWSTAAPSSFIRLLVGEIANELTPVHLSATLLLQHPEMALLQDKQFLGAMTFADILQDTKARLDRIERASKTAIAYADALDKGDIASEKFSIVSNEYPCLMR